MTLHGLGLGCAIILIAAGAWGQSVPAGLKVTKEKSGVCKAQITLTAGTSEEVAKKIAATVGAGK